jgi:hypothetical protein
MTTNSLRVFLCSQLAAGAAVLFLAAPASAQAPATDTTTSAQQLDVVPPAATDDRNASTTTAPTVADTTTAAEQATSTAVQPNQFRGPYWASIGGFEVDTHETGYGFFGPQFIRPFHPSTAFVAAANANYLYYEYDTGVGHTNVRSPGATVMGGVMLGARNYLQLMAGPTFRRRHIEAVDGADRVIGSSSDTHVGMNFMAAGSVDPTTHNNFLGMLNYDAVDRYTWGRAAFKEQIGNFGWSGRFTPYVGAEFIGQGNPDIRSHQYGGFFEITHVPSSISVMFRAGYKRSSFDFGPDKTGPWFAIGFYQRLR